MAVQAQYPSNVLLLNSGQEGHEFSLQQQAGGVFLDQSQMFFNNGSNYTNNNNNNNNPRKRGKEVAAEAAITAPINSFSLQTQPPQLIDLSQLHQPNVVSTGLRLSFGDQQQNLPQNQNQSYQHQQHHHLQQQNLVSNSSAFLSIVSDDLGTQIKRQREELDQFLQAQGEELRRTLAEKRHRHYRALLGAAEESVARRLREKEAEVEKATRRNAELEARAAQLSVEAQVWQAKARAQEATAASLQAQLQQAIMSGGAAVTQDSRRGEKGLKCPGGVEGQAEDAESAYVDPERVIALGPACKACRTRVSSVVLLPCRHLCLCTECDRVAQACPLCLTVRNSSVEVFLS
ncbi:E3 ubiquitin-protein ligase BOI-like isoform X2 [Durio zibethinus]|uniref:E3 ubiquitin-protein ligase BOI-like isoform X2 n=1 Tax=Durio zibethinus TaxID=66656 RepID=A0A6P5Y832_DURZI|nr:E3 ubiquitin-protein ligase BOI-like isoform X2 [Durio zibethinus]